MILLRIFTVFFFVPSFSSYRILSSILESILDEVNLNIYNTYALSQYESMTFSLFVSFCG